jgi:hypothetical protein
VLLWEVCALGKTPYEGMHNMDVIDAVQKGLRLPRPPHTSAAM